MIQKPVENENESALQTWLAEEINLPRYPFLFLLLLIYCKAF
jgi:hypothetical protein